MGFFVKFGIFQKNTMLLLLNAEQCTQKFYYHKRDEIYRESSEIEEKKIIHIEKSEREMRRAKKQTELPIKVIVESMNDNSIVKYLFYSKVEFNG